MSSQGIDLGERIEAAAALVRGRGGAAANQGKLTQIAVGHTNQHRCLTAGKR